MLGIKGMWRANAGVLTILILVNLLLSATGPALWTVIAAALLIAAMFVSYRQGMDLGHGACGVSSTVQSALDAGDRVYAQLDRAYLAQVWRPSTGFRGLLASALLPYAAGGVYIILSLLSAGGGISQTALILSRTVAWLLSLPYWPFIMHGHSDFIALTPDIAAMLLLTPFVLPLCQFGGYMQGPKLWQRTEEAMIQGRRRAKARARVGRRLVGGNKKPEI